MKQIELSQGKFALVDDDDYEYINKFKWYAMKCKNTFYAVRHQTICGKKTLEMMHRVILNANKPYVVDHKSGDGLDNTKNNIRICTQKQNLQNKKSSGACKFKGVSYDKSRSKWMAQIKYDGKKKTIGRFSTETQAAIAYNLYASHNFGEYAKLNNI